MDNHMKLYEQFLMLGVHEDCMNRVTIAKLQRCQTFNSDDDEMISLKENVGRIKEGQNDIFYITGDSVAALSFSPFFENLRKMGLEVLTLAADTWSS